MKEKMEQAVLAYMRRKDYRPLNKSEFARALEIPSDERSALRRSLKDLESTGKILRAKKGRFVLQESDEQTVMGTFRRRARGGELAMAKGGTAHGRVRARRLAIPHRFAGTAMDGDRVLVRLRRRSTDDPHWLKHLPKSKQESLRERFRKEREEDPTGLEGEVVKVLERSGRLLVGTLRGQGDWGTFAPDNERLPKQIDLPEGLPDGAAVGDKALVRVVSWEAPRRAPQGVVVRVLGPADAPGVDILSIIHKHGLPTEFPEEVLDEAAAIEDLITDEALASREDWRAAEVITIDPFDARDFDDAIGVKTLDDGGWELAVHIADVAHFVRPGSAIDREARHRGNSVYLVDRVLPMLPEKLSNGICSLVPDQERLTFCAVMRFDKSGRRTEARFTPAVIRSRKRLSYEEAFERLQRKDESDETSVLLGRAWQLAALLRKRRFKNGSLDLDFPESKVILNAEGKPTEIRVVENDESHQLIEEFMLAANEAVAETILKSGRPSLYRIHDDPDPDKLLEFRDTVLQHGYPVGDLAHRKELQKLIGMIKNQPDEPVLKLALLKSLKRAAYHQDSLGHYGLAKANYTHFTSPIRRYTDLVVHRVLRALLVADSSGATPSYKAVADLAEHLSTTERTAAEAENETTRLKVTEYFERIGRENPSQSFEVLVTDVTRMGLFVEILGHGTRGLIRVHDLPGDRPYRFEPHQLRFNGGRGRIYKVGDRLEATLTRVDRQRGFIDLCPV